jgi:M6 family metalloprotease-like protein
MFILSLAVYAVPARPILFTVTQPDGTTASVYLRGDEYFRYYESVDGYTLIYDKDKYLVYAIQNQDGDLIPSNIKVCDTALLSAEDSDFISGISKHLRFGENQKSAKKRMPIYSGRAAKKSGASEHNLSAASGVTHALCVLAQFPDKSFTKTPAQFDQLLNQTAYSEDGAAGSVHDFYLEDSYGHIDMEVTVVGPFTSAHNMNYYGEDYNDFDRRPEKLAEEAANYAFAQPGINPEDFDNDGDGYIDAMHVIYAGYGQESGAPDSTIWAHAWILPNLHFGSKILDVYSCSPELRSNAGSDITRIGVICHELGHIFGAPDFYDADGPNPPTGYWGTGHWDLMASGSWNGPGRDGSRPAHTNMYQKIQNGWVTPVVLASTQTVTDMPNSVESPSAYIINTSVANDYFVLENRQQKSFDAFIPSHGLLIYHASLTPDDIYNNTVNTDHPQKMYIVCAAATVNPSSTVASYSFNGAGNYNSYYMPFPGQSGKTSFTSSVFPTATAWDGSAALGNITNITESDEKISFNFTDATSDVKTLNIGNVNIYPNPVRQGEILTVDTETENINFSIYSISGKKLYEEIINRGSVQKEINLPAGIYLLKINSQIFKTVVM